MCQLISSSDHEIRRNRNVSEPLILLDMESDEDEDLVPVEIEEIHVSSAVEDQPPLEPLPSTDQFTPLFQSSEEGHVSDGINTDRYFPDSLEFLQRFNNVRRQQRRRRISSILRKSMKLMKKSKRYLRKALRKHRKSRQLMKTCFRLFLNTNLDDI